MSGFQRGNDALQPTEEREPRERLGVGPEHAYLKDSGRATYVAVTDRDALAGFALLSRLEGVIPALETAHAVAWIASQRGRWTPDQRVLLCVSGRGDKDVAQISQLSTLPE